MPYTLQEYSRAFTRASNRHAVGTNAALLMPCMYTTVMVQGNLSSVSSRYEITKAMIDSGSSSNCISRRAAQSAGLTIFPTTPTWFTMANGSLECNNQYVSFEITISSMRSTIKAYVTDNTDNKMLLLGQPAIHQFMICPRPLANGTTRITGALNATGYRNRRVVIYKDPAHVLPTITSVNQLQYGTWVNNRNETATEMEHRLKQARMREKIRQRIRKCQGQTAIWSEEQAKAEAKLRRKLA